MSAHDERAFAFEAYTLHATRRVLTCGDQPVLLRPKSFDVLRVLVERAGRVVDKAELFDAVWPDVVATDESLARCVSDIRLALGDREHRIVKTVPGRGYVLASPVARAVTSPPKENGASPRVPTDRPSIAVLPFADMSGGPEHDFFADGITEDITTALCRLDGFLVIARNTMSTYKGQAVDVTRLGRELGVRYVLEGSVRRAGDAIRVTAQLLEAAGGRHVWAERYDRRVEHVFAIQDEITASIVGRLGTELLAAEYARVSRKPTHDLDAWACVVRALHHSSQQSESETRTAIGFLDRALAHEPDYARALGMKAWILVFRAFQGWEDMGEVLSATGPLIARAMAANNDELWPYLAQGMVGYATRDNALSMSALGRAVELYPNSVNVYGLLGNAHAFGGRPSDALACIRYAMRLSPRDTYLSDFDLYLAFAHLQGRDYEEALHFARQASRLRPGHAYPLLLGAAAAGYLGEREVGATLLAILRQLVPVISAEWVETTSPFCSPEDRAHLVEGLRRAGL